MTSALKHFFITFAVCLLIFAILGVMVYQKIVEGFNNFGKGSGDESDVSEVVSDEASDTVSLPESGNKTDYNEDGDIFTAVVMCVDEENTVVNCAFIDSNGKTGKYIYCVIPPATKIANEIGNAVPIADMFGTMSPDEICKCVSAMTGIETNYCFRFQKDDMSTIASLLPGPSIKLTFPVKIPLFDEEEEKEDNKKEEDDKTESEASKEEVTPPEDDDRYLTIENDENGKVNLNKSVNGKSNLQWLLESEKEETGIRKNTLYATISRELFRQFFVDQQSTKKVAVLTRLMSISVNNFNANAAEKYLDLLFANSRFDYHSYTYPSNWGTAVEDLRKFDGRYKPEYLKTGN